MDSFFKYANAAQKAVITGITSAHKEFFENLDSNQTKLEFVVGEQQKGGGNSGKFKVYSKFSFDIFSFKNIFLRESLS